MNDALIGRKLANFRIERLLGRGGMARVYYGLDIKLRRPVAIKIIDERYRKRPLEVKRFLKEAQLMAKWRHENIVQIYYCGDEGDLYYYVMEYIDGKDLASVLAGHAVKKKLMPVDEVLRIGAALANALDYAHSQGVIHRDVKPSNVLIASSGRVALSDFGLALDIRDGSLGEAFGTPHYISPEQALHSANAVPQSDIYSLGVILYEMLTGHVPFADPSPTSAALQHIGQLPPSPREFNPGLPSAAEKVLLRALEKSPGKRYQSGAELLEALKKALQATQSAAAKPALPPIPVGVPTIRLAGGRPAIPKEAARPRGRTTPLASPPASLTEKRPRSNRPAPAGRRGIPAWLVVLAVLACLGSVIVLWANGMIDPARLPWLKAPASLPTAAPTLTEQAALLPAAQTAPPATLTPYPASKTPRAQKTEPAAITDTPQATPSLPPPSATASALPSQTPAEAPAVSPTVKYPTGNLFTLIYDDNGLYLLNRSPAIRSVSGFSFERLDAQGQALETFPGWRWSQFSDNLPPERCVILEVYDEFPYLDPPECARFTSKLNPERASGLIFWTAQEDSRQFRVLWRGEEVARCQTGAGRCDFYTP